MANRPMSTRAPVTAGHLLLREAGRELRVARITCGMRQADVAAQLGTSTSRISRVEPGLISGLGLVSLSRQAAVVGLKPWLRLFPTGPRPMDHAQLELFGRFRDRIAPAWNVTLEAPMPIRGDLRAADALLAIPGCRCIVEVITRLADVQAQLRAARLKQRDLGADRLVLVVASNGTNRRAVRAAGPTLLDSLPLETKGVLRALAAGRDPGADGLVLL